VSESDLYPGNWGSKVSRCGFGKIKTGIEAMLLCTFDESVILPLGGVVPSYHWKIDR